MNVELTQPWFLLGLFALPVLGWYFLRGLTDFARWQRALSLAARTGVVVLLVLALCGISWLKPAKDKYVVFAVDESLSVGDEARREVEKYLDEATAARGRHQVAFVKFGAEPGVVTTNRHAPQTIKAEGTNIAAALEVATASIPPSYVPNIVVLSDGNQTVGDAVRAALRGGVPVSTVPLSTRGDPEVQLAAVYVPAQVR